MPDHDQATKRRTQTEFNSVIKTDVPIRNTRTPALSSGGCFNTFFRTLLCWRSSFLDRLRPAALTLNDRPGVVQWDRYRPSGKIRFIHRAPTRIFPFVVLCFTTQSPTPFSRLRRDLRQCVRTNSITLFTIFLFFFIYIIILLFLAEPGL